MEGGSPFVLTLLGTGLTYSLTALGASFVFLKRSPGGTFLDTSLGFAAGVMIAASFWSLLLPAIELCKEEGLKPYLWPPMGFLSGAVLLRMIDRFLPHLHLGDDISLAEGVRTHLPKSTLLILAITIHNLPEGMAVGVGFSGGQESVQGINAGWALAIGIGIQNLPEGLAVALPLRGEGLGRAKSFFFGQLSGLVEPIGGLIGVSLAEIAGVMLPFVFSFAAGAMIYVVVEEVIPESQKGGHHDWATMGTIMGFICMMILDVALS
ncbi:MAG: ZIP family metal transporter [Desulfatiglandales bacterium]